MWIKTFSKLIELTALEEYTLEAGSEVVIDGQNYFYKLYKESELKLTFGCETDKYADYLRKRLMMFKKANIKCYFILNGGIASKHAMVGNYIKNSKNNESPDNSDSSSPIFMKETCTQVLDELGLHYTICQYQAVDECIAMAQKRKCPLLSFDVKMCFTNVMYIPYNLLKYDEGSNTIPCKMYQLDKFLAKYKLNEEKLAIFVVLTDTKIFPEDHFMDFVNHLNLPHGHYKRNLGIINWLSKMKRKPALEQIFRFHPDDKEMFLEADGKMREFIGRRPAAGVPTAYLENALVVDENDPLWFEKGVAAKHIAPEYVNVYKHGVITGSSVIDDGDSRSAMRMSCDIVKYALDLMTDFRNKGLTLTTRTGRSRLMTTLVQVQKPDYAATNCVFEDGWDTIVFLNLFEHYFIETLGGFDFCKLAALPEDCRLLMVALVYFTRKKVGDTTNEVYSVLLSYVALSLNLLDKHSTINLNPEEAMKPDLTTDASVTEADKETVRVALRKYTCSIGLDIVSPALNRTILHPLVELQYLILHVNYLNTLCGSPFKSTIYSKTYNGTYVFKILCDIRESYGGDGIKFLKQTLGPAPTVYAYMNSLLGVYNEYTCRDGL